MAARTDAGIEPEVHRDVLGLGEQVTRRVEHRRRAVGPLLDVRARRRPAQHRAHLVGDAAEPRHQHLQARGVEAHGRLRSTRAPAAPGSAVQPSGSQIVQSGSAIAAGPRAGDRDGAGRSVSSKRARERGRGADGDDLDRGVGAGEAVALPVGLVEGGRPIPR